MKLGFVSAILPDLPLAEVLQFAAQNGYACVELMCWPRGRAERRYAGVTHIDVNALDAAEISRIHRLVAETGVSISALGYYPNPLVASDAEAEVVISHLRAVISGAAKLGIQIVNTFVGRDPGLSQEQNWALFGKRWPALVAHAEKEGVRIGIENCPMFFSRDEYPGGKNLAVSPAAWRRMFETIPSHAWGLNYDPSHLVWQQMDWLAPLHDFADRLIHIHAKDVLLDRRRLNDVGILATPLEYHCPKLPGLGEIAWGKFLSVLGETGYKGAVCVEVEDRQFEHSLEGRMAALRQARQTLQPLLPPDRTPARD
ncbi:sugar phosphate isomerase/epimerase family protein [Nibricoccus sp. IMCC34717]|uniref:sugar phosphate isomerase/epimerase family protein n=1 Tax=Nibricoccus sp. IMCC34717 TaxID=3034021 RepID=UPI00385006CC